MFTRIWVLGVALGRGQAPGWPVCEIFVELSVETFVEFVAHRGRPAARPSTPPEKTRATAARSLEFMQRAGLEPASP
jgi:hypothetical protein